MNLRFLSYLLRGDSLVIGRWHWVKARLPMTANGDRLIDIGCGSGAFTIGAALRGYTALGLSWDRANQNKAEQRAKSCGVGAGTSGAGCSDSTPGQAVFEVCDVRHLHEKPEFACCFDVALCCECAEHILDDRKLLRDIFSVLKPGGRLLFTSPNFYYHELSAGDRGPFCKEESGWHVRRGYSPSMLRELCQQSGLFCEEISYSGGFFAQKVTALQRSLQVINARFAWCFAFPFRWLAVFDGLIQRIFHYRDYSICMVAVKPRYADQTASAPPEATNAA